MIQHIIRIIPILPHSQLPILIIIPPPTPS